MTAKREEKELRIVWLDLANAYWSVPHNCSKFALKFFHIPEKVTDILMQYFRNVFMRFATTNYTTGWQALEVGIMIDGLHCLTSAVCHLYGADPTRHQRHYQRWRNQKWRCPTTIEGIHGRCNHTRPVQSGHTGATGPLPPLHMGTDEGQAEEKSKSFPCLWDHMWHPFLHRWQHHPHSPGAASQESRQVICLPTHRQTQRSRGTEDCPGGPSCHR